MVAKKTVFDQSRADVTDIILESISDGVFTVDHNWKITSFNRAAEEITGISRSEAIGRHCWEVFRSNMCERDCALKKTMEEGKACVNSATYIVTSDRKQVPITVATSLLKDRDGNIVGGVETFRDHSLEEALRRDLDGTCRMGDIVSCSPEMKKMFSILPRVAESESTVLIEGETGTGKELTARAIHALSLRKNKAFVALNCGALPDTLLESELFGYKAGAFTGAVKDKPGLFAAAEGGTLFLDEIGDTSAAFQTRLLRVLEEKEFQPLGSVQKSKADVRVIAATNRNLVEMVHAGTFRQDLFYRINVVTMQLPPLRKRMEDMELLVDFFIARFNRLRGKSITGISREALAILMAHDFPGNIRELENIIEHAFVLCLEGDIDVVHFPVNLAPPRCSEAEASVADPLSLAASQVILAALQRNNYNRAAAAKELGIHKSTLFRKIRKLGICLPLVDGRSRSSFLPG
ncbi:MAG: sigma 54-interacting transcriptional regulator [Desulfobulbaceae bacterium]|jgi:PAS domain S-box-containing protein|nr:sigma 54-interacting transcriptional regulator [Desulfobulbaceae bacterium]